MPVACLAVGSCQVMWPTFCLVSAQPYLATTLQHLLDMLSPNPHLLYPVMTALHGDRDSVTSFILDPSTDPCVIRLMQHYGRVPVLKPLFQVSRAWVWSAHRARMRMLGLEQFLL